MSDLNYGKRDLFSSIGRNKEQNDEIIEEAARRYRKLHPTGGGLESLEAAPATPEEDRVQAALAGEDIADNAMEAIIRIVGRPVIRIQNNGLVAADITTNALRNELEEHTEIITRVVQSVGRIELTGHRRLPWAGTGWVIDDDIIVTNRHVANEFGSMDGAAFTFLPGVFGGPVGVNVDFFKEHEIEATAAFRIVEILHIEPAGGPDLAFLRVDWESGSGDKRQKLPLATTDVNPEHRVAVIGYPARDTRTDIPDKMDEIFDGIYNVKRFAPGFVITASEQAGMLTHDCTTLGGNSGSAIIDFETGEAIALHFAGREEEANFAVLSSVVAARLRETRSGKAFVGKASSPSNVVVEETPTVDEMSDRNGYDPDFLGVRVDLPAMDASLRDQVAPVEGRDDGELKYTHYSVAMNADRKIAFYAVANIDGEKLFKVPRGSDKWFFDPRIADDHQVGNTLYKNNPLDRGHLVRRLDPAWGSERDTAELGVEDSFFYTNCAPQHLKLNRHVWLGLEDYILDNAGAFDLKVSVFTGPVFRQDDPEHRGVQVPNEFWKVVVMRKPADHGGPGDLSATAYVLTQKSLIDDLEFVFGEHQGFQVRLEVVEKLTGLDFGNLRDADPLAAVSENEAFRTGASMRGHRLRSLKDIVF